MNKQAYLEEVYSSAFEDELEKIAKPNIGGSVEQLYSQMAKASKTKHTPEEKKMQITKLRKRLGSYEKK